MKSINGFVSLNSIYSWIYSEYKCTPDNIDQSICVDNVLRLFAEKHFIGEITVVLICAYDLLIILLIIRCRRHSKCFRNLFDSFCFYKMKAVIIFLRWGRSAPPCPSGLGCTPDPAFPQWHQVPIGLTSQYTKLKTNLNIILVNICNLKVTDTFLPYFVSPNKCNISNNTHFCIA